MKLSVIVMASLALAGCAAHETSKNTASMDEGSSMSTPATAADWDGVVQSIDPAGSLSAGGAVGAAAAGAGNGYRVVVKKADGSTETINVDSMPSYRVGDNVRYANGTLSSSPKY